MLAIERFAAISFLAIGLSHLLRPGGWSEFFVQLRAKGEPGAFINGMLSLNFGALLVAFHGTQWQGIGVLVTLLGWVQVLKGTVHLCFPAYSLRSMAQVTTPEGARKFVPAGVIMAVLGVVMLVGSFR